MSSKKKGKNNQIKKENNELKKSNNKVNSEEKNAKETIKTTKEKTSNQNLNKKKDSNETSKNNNSENGKLSNNKKVTTNTKTNSESQSKAKNNLKGSNNEKNLKKNSDTTKKEQNKSKEEIVFKNSKFKENKDKEIKKTEKNTVSKTTNEEKKPISKDKEIKKKVNNTKRVAIIILVIILLVFLLIFSIIFAMMHATKDTIARGVSIKNIDVSNLTYNEAKTKLEEAFNVAIGVNTNLSYDDFSYVIASSDINLSYDLTNALNEAYNIGRTGNIIQNNYELVKTALVNKNIDVQFTYDEDALSTIIEYVATNVPNLVKQYSYYIDGDNLVITPGVDGIEVKKEELKNTIIEKIQNRNLSDLLNNASDDNIEIPYSEVVANSIDIDIIYNEVKSEPQNAYYVEATETTKFEIYPDVDGVDFAISLDEAKNIVSEAGKEQYIIPLTITKAEITINNIGIEAFPYQVSKARTNYDASNTSRSENLRIAASKINGTVLMPGEQFSFNGVVGERTVSEGYQDAKIYSNGQVVDGLAGGICQISSTLYSAVLSANLQVDERYNHSFTTSYAKPGTDATVVYGIKDLKFTNTRTYPIKIEASVSGGICTFTIYGIEEENEYEVKIIPVTTSTTPYTTQTVVDYSLPSGSSVVKQAGANGCKVTTYKEVYLNGIQISREAISNDTYQVMTRIVNVGPTATPTIAEPETPTETQTQELPTSDGTAETTETVQ